MTEITENTDKKNALPEAVDAFILQWGNLGGQWGVNRSIGQIHAYLYLADGPRTAEDIAGDLEMARSNVSNSVKELLAWNLIHRVPIRHDRREHFEAETDVWEIAARIASGRKAREIDPALAILQECVGKAENDPTVSNATRERLRNMMEFTASVDRWYTQMMAVPKNKRDVLLKLGSKIASFLPLGKD
ncbi:GbsR/MarR family transcriptional regulator [Hoeflea sp. TYP-13]|uniref:GbsR/MarR family transcriptional regulator n=1 Tax=Hoeflea sp. TYP-13 TaxID=3230023 RepID=UPI0034C6B3FE